MALRFYDSITWRNIRNAFISANPLCNLCDRKGRATIATQVDHITSIRMGGNKTDWNNLQSLCDTCHSRKTRKENQKTKKAIMIVYDYADTGELTENNRQL